MSGIAFLRFYLSSVKEMARSLEASGPILAAGMVELVDTVALEATGPWLRLVDAPQRHPMRVRGPLPASQLYFAVGSLYINRFPSPALIAATVRSPSSSSRLLYRNSYSAR